MSKFPLLDRRGRRERMIFFASVGVVDKLNAREALLIEIVAFRAIYKVASLR